VSHLFLFDDAVARRFEPFALTRPISEMRSGALLVRERWERALGVKAAGVMASPHLAPFDEPGAPRPVSGKLPKGSVIASTRFSPALARAEAAAAWRFGGRVVAVTLTRDVDVGELEDGRAPLDRFANESGRFVDITGWWMDRPWDFVGTLDAMLRADLAVLTRELRSHPEHTGVFVEDGATVEPHTFIDTSKGPVLLRRGATVEAFTRLMGPMVVGEESIVGVDRITGCSIGDHCKIHGELSATIVLGHANKSHDGFVGHSYLGRWVNLGAGTITSNLKNTYGPVHMWTPDGERDTGMQFLGTLFGDHTKTGIGTTLNTGTVIGAGANIYGTAVGPKVIPPFAWGDRAPYSTYELRKFLDVAKRVMSRRHVELSAGQAQVLTAAFERRWSVDEE
jgi:UDP-N-acetylglucosamine diphosphorylase/glucosamine-1-phosphate N-acetyltransferase